MTTKECYDEMGAVYADVLERLGSEEMIRKFIKKFPQDHSFADLKAAMAGQDVETCFRAAHTMKGVCLNLGLAPLYTISAEMTEKLRQGEYEGCPELFCALEVQYDKAISCISRLA